MKQLTSQQQMNIFDKVWTSRPEYFKMGIITLCIILVFILLYQFIKNFHIKKGNLEIYTDDNGKQRTRKVKR